MRRMNEEELNYEQINQIDSLEDAARELIYVMSNGKYDGTREDCGFSDVYLLIECAQEVVEKAGFRAYFPTHIDDGVNSYTIDYTDEEIKNYVANMEINE